MIAPQAMQDLLVALADRPTLGVIDLLGLSFSHLGERHLSGECDVGYVQQQTPAPADVYAPSYR